MNKEKQTTKVPLKTLQKNNAQEVTTEPYEHIRNTKDTPDEKTEIDNRRNNTNKNNIPTHHNHHTNHSMKILHNQLKLDTIVHTQ